MVRVRGVAVVGTVRATVVVVARSAGLGLGRAVGGRLGADLAHEALPFMGRRAGDERGRQDRAEDEGGGQMHGRQVVSGEQGTWVQTMR